MVTPAEHALLGRDCNQECEKDFVVDFGECHQAETAEVGTSVVHGLKSVAEHLAAGGGEASALQRAAEYGSVLFLEEGKGHEHQPTKSEPDVVVGDEVHQ